MKRRSVALMVVAGFSVFLWGPPSDLYAQSSASGGKKAAGNENTALSTAARNGDTQALTTLLKRPDVDVNNHTLQEKTPLMWAALYGHLRAVQALLAAGARLEEKDSGGATALTYASVAWHEDVVAFLKSKGAQPPEMDRIAAATWALTQPTDVFDYINKRADEAKKKP